MIAESMFDLVSMGSPSPPASAVLASFYSGGVHGGGTFVWDASRPRSQANGGTIVDPTSIGGWNGTSTNLANFLNAQGSGGGNGCWVRTEQSAPEIYWWGATGTASTADDLAANKAFDTLGDDALWLIGGEFGQGSPALYAGGAFSESLAGQISVGTANNPSTRGEPVLRITKWGAVNRSIVPDQWDQGCIYIESRKVGSDSDASYSAMTVVARQMSNQGEGGRTNMVAAHHRGIAETPDSRVWGSWDLVTGPPGGTDQIASMIGQEINVQTRVASDWDPGDGPALLGRAVGLLIVTSANGDTATHGLVIGRQGGTGGWRTGLLIRQNAVESENPPSTSIGNGEALRVSGNSSVSARIGGVRFDRGNFHYGISFSEINSVTNNTAILLGQNHRIAWGSSPAVNPTGGYVQSTATTNPGNIRFEDAESGSITLRLANGTVALRTRNSEPDNPVLVRVGGAAKTLEVGAPNSGGSGFRMVRVAN